MANILQVAEVAAMLGDPARANMMLALGDGRALPAGELAAGAGVTPQTASAHLSRLVQAGLLTVVQQGRHRYFRLASARVGELLEAVMAVATEAPRPRLAASRIDPRLRAARTCYNHLAGRLGVAIADAMAAAGHVRLSEEGAEVMPAGLAFLGGLGIELPRRDPVLLCRTCIDWSERRLHLAGHVGAAICRRCAELGWIERRRDSRAVSVTAGGRAGLRSVFGIEAAILEPDRAPPRVAERPELRA